MNIKEELYNACCAYVFKKEKTVKDIISSNQKALQSETKSSAGDKHETGRAMLQLEMEKASQQIAVVAVMKETLAKVNFNTTNKIVSLGSLVTTNLANYYFAVGAGQILINDNMYFAISVASPIGSLLLGKQQGDSVLFNGKNIIIKHVE